MATPSSESQNTSKNLSSRPPGCGYALLVMVFRVLLLLAGGGLSILVGMAIATQVPATVSDPPLLEQLFRVIYGVDDGAMRSPNGAPSSSDPS